MANWQSPSFTEVDMSAEIGGYQGDYGPGNEGPDYMPDFVQPARAQNTSDQIKSEV